MTEPLDTALETEQIVNSTKAQSVNGESSANYSITHGHSAQKGIISTLSTRFTSLFYSNAPKTNLDENIHTAINQDVNNNFSATI